jgi:hypothetical protein
VPTLASTFTPSPSVTNSSPTKTPPIRDLYQEREQTETYCREFLKGHFGGGEERFKGSIEAWMSIELGPTLAGADSSASSLQQQPITQALNEKGEEEVSEGTVHGSPVSCKLLLGATKELNKLFSDWRTWKEIQKRRWKVECILALRVAELRELVRKEKKNKGEKQWNWTEVQEVLCEGVRCKVSRMKHILTVAPVESKFGKENLVFGLFFGVFYFFLVSSCFLIEVLCVD